ncbi:MAG: EamA family transporter, partial [Bacteroidota bacterium]
MKISKKSIVELSLFIVAVIWALNFSVVKYSLAEIDPLSFNGLRFLFAAAIIWIVLLYRKQLFT